jgi:hypothetical protein
MRSITIFALAVCAALVGAVRDAEAQYAARCVALTDAVKSIEGLTPADRESMNKAITDYCIKRAACLVEVRTALQKKTDIKVDGAWPTCVSSPPLDALDKGVAGISEGNRSKMPGVEAISLVQQEAQFFQLLNGTLKTVALSRDEVAAAAVEIAKDVIVVRDREWPAIQTYGQRFCRELADNMRYRLYQTGLDKARDGIAKWREVLAELGNYRQEAGGGAVWQRALVSLEIVMTSFNNARTSNNQRDAIDKAMRGGGGTSEMYWRLRYRSDDYLAKVKGREDKLREATTALDNFVGNARANGQAADAKALSELLKVELERVRTEYVTVLGEFATHHDSQVTKLRASVMCEEQWRALQSKFSNENTRRDIADFRAMLKNSLSGSMRDEFDRQLGSAMRQADAALEQEDREQQADQRLADEGLSKSTK